MVRRAFHAMGTEIECLLERPHDAVAKQALDAVEAEFERLESLFSRFRPDSELSRLNAAGDAIVGPDLLELAEVAVRTRERTGGRFDPTIHNALVGAGYDRSFELVSVRPESASEPWTARDASSTIECGGAILVDRPASRVTLAPGTRLDFGGIAKGHAADRACAVLGGAGPCLVSAGGDIAVHGEPSPGVWAISVPTGDGEITLGLAHGGIATSGIDRRRWRQGDDERHHIIDPALARPANTDLLRVTVIAASATEAETLATSLLLAGGFGLAATEADAAGIPCVLVSRDGRTRLGGGLE